MSSADMLTWLRSTIEGDKAAAEAAGGHTWTVHVEADGNCSISVNGEYKTAYSCGCCCDGTLDPEQAEHMCRHDPRDTIARCEAELALLDEHAVEDTGFGKYCRVCSEYSTKPGEESELEPAPAPCRTVRLLAATRRHREGFNPEWVSG